MLMNICLQLLILIWCWLDFELVQQHPKSFWKDKENQKAYLSWLGTKLNFTSLEDWYKLTISHFQQFHGTGMLNTGERERWGKERRGEEEHLAWLRHDLEDRYQRDRWEVGEVREVRDERGERVFDLFDFRSWSGVQVRSSAVFLKIIVIFCWSFYWCWYQGCWTTTRTHHRNWWSTCSPTMTGNSGCSKLYVFSFLFFSFSSSLLLTLFIDSYLLLVGPYPFLGWGGEREVVHDVAWRDARIHEERGLVQNQTVELHWYGWCRFALQISFYFHSFLIFSFIFSYFPARFPRISRFPRFLFLFSFRFRFLFFDFNEVQLHAHICHLHRVSWTRVDPLEIRFHTQKLVARWEKQKKIHDVVGRYVER